MADVGLYTKKPPSEWKHKGDKKQPYWKKWEEEDKPPEPPKVKGRRKKTEWDAKHQIFPNKFEVRHDDIVHFLQNKLVMKEDGRPLPHEVIDKFLKVYHDVLSDLLVEHSFIEVGDLGVFYVRRGPERENIVFKTSETMLRRLNKTYEKKIAITSYLIDEITDDRARRHREAMKNAEYRLRKKQAEVENGEE